MLKSGIGIKWIATTTFEIRLPSGRIILFDPWLGRDGKIKDDVLETTIDDIDGADWMFISHSHGDHCAAVQQINEKFMEGTNGGRIYMPALSAYNIAKKYDVPFRDVLPVYPYETFDFDEFTITALPCRHRGDPTPPSEGHKMMAQRGVTDELDIQLGDIGNLDELDWAVTLKEDNIRFMVLGGGLYHFNNTPNFCKKFNPLFVTRQISNILAKDPVTFAKYCDMYHAPFVFPSHHDLGIYPTYKDYTPFIEQVNEELRKMGSGTVLVNTERGRWYEIGAYLKEA